MTVLTAQLSAATLILRHVEVEVLEVRPSRSRPGEGYVKCRSTTFNQDGQPVQVLVMNLLVPGRPPS